MDIDEYLDKLKQVDVHESLFKYADPGCTFHEFRLMDMIAGGDFRLKDLSGKRAIAPQGVGRMCKALEKRGLVVVQKDSRDGRARIPTLTKYGESIETRARLLLRRLVS
jgi:DNA-binding MarR family transcriptional regulator